MQTSESKPPKYNTAVLFHTSECSIPDSFWDGNKTMHSIRMQVSPTARDLDRLIEGSPEVLKSIVSNAGPNTMLVLCQKEAIDSVLERVLSRCEMRFLEEGEVLAQHLTLYVEDHRHLSASQRRTLYLCYRMIIDGANKHFIDAGVPAPKTKVDALKALGHMVYPGYALPLVTYDIESGDLSTEFKLPEICDRLTIAHQMAKAQSKLLLDALVDDASQLKSMRSYHSSDED